ncbi:MAG: fusion protein [Prevotellaceae bacterium]|nr:fusion protein [Prevotellaceae bacterium]
MTKVNLLFAGTTYDTDVQVVEKGQIIRMEGYNYDRYAVCDIVKGDNSLIYKLINLETYDFGQCDLIRPLSKKFGIGYYFDDENPAFKTSDEMAVILQKANEKKAEQDRIIEAVKIHVEQLKIIGRERLQAIIPKDAKAVIIASVRKDTTDTDYSGYGCKRTVILGFSTQTKNSFQEMRNHAGNFGETKYLAEKNTDFEHRKNYTGGSYYLGENKYSGWIIEKETIGYIEHFINRYAIIASEEKNIRLAQVQAVEAAVEGLTGNFTIVDYSEKALAIFGDTKLIKDQLKALGGRFNPNLTHNEEKTAGWIFSKSKRTELEKLLQQ